VLDSIRQGRVYTSVDALAAGAFMDPGAEAPAWPPGARVVQLGPDAKSGWFEVYRTGAPGTPPVPWILTNPVDAPQPPPAPAVAPIDGGVAVATEWRIEKDQTSAGSLTVTTESRLAVDYRLHGGARESQFVAVAGDLTGGAAADQIVFDGQARGPMRLSVQLRFPGADRRWIKSVFLDGHPRTIVVPVGEMVSAERLAGTMPNPATARSLLFVVDLTNAAPGSAGSFSLGRIRLASGGPR